MAQVLLYNIKGEKLKRVRTVLVRTGLRGRIVAPEEYAHPIGYLVAQEGFEPSAETPEPFGAEMLVMHDLPQRQFSALLDALRTARATVALKAVVTESNAAWSSTQLYAALQSEHDTMQELIAAKKAKDAQAGK